MFAVLLAGLDATVVGTVMPTVISNLGGMALYSWVFSAYMLTTAVSMPIWGKLSDIYSKKKIFYFAILFFLIGSVLSGFSQSMIQLIIFRAVQGIGAGGLSAVPFTIIGSIFTPEKRSKGAGALSATWGIASILGPITGSIIVTHFSWRLAFLINVPIGILSVLLIKQYYSELIKKDKQKIDYFGAIIFVISILSFLLAFLQFGKGAVFYSSEVISFLLISIILFLVFIKMEGRFGNPIVSLENYRIKSFGVGNLLAFLSGFAIYGVISFVPLFVQSIQGKSPIMAGLALMPMSLAWSFSSFSSGQIIPHYGNLKMIRIGFLLMIIGFTLSMFLNYDSTFIFIILFIILIGAGMGFVTPAILVTVQNSVEKKNLGVATSSQMLARTLGGTIGVSIMGSILSNSMQRNFDILLRSGTVVSASEILKSNLDNPQILLSSKMRSQMLPDELNIVLSVFTGSLQNVFLLALIVVLLAMIMSFQLRKF
ncbi:MAG: drug resistance transporter, EmrB/QacA family [Ignavibacteriae bacterium]|nr:MAG: drug resistance transporter, EmrB/QacA family [Ignavibacteriota bacterium]